jgi:hypothetical protein
MVGLLLAIIVLFSVQATGLKLACKTNGKTVECATALARSAAAHRQRCCPAWFVVNIGAQVLMGIAPQQKTRFLLIKILVTPFAIQTIIVVGR